MSIAGLEAAIDAAWERRAELTPATRGETRDAVEPITASELFHLLDARPIGLVFAERLSNRGGEAVELRLRKAQEGHQGRPAEREGERRQMNERRHAVTDEDGNDDQKDAGERQSVTQDHVHAEVPLRCGRRGARFDVGPLSGIG